jgi:hypothetical protein
LAIWSGLAFQLRDDAVENPMNEMIAASSTVRIKKRIKTVALSFNRLEEKLDFD